MTYFQRLRFNLAQIGLSTSLMFNIFILTIALNSDKTHDQLRVFFRHTFFEYLALTGTLAIIGSFIKNDWMYQKDKIEKAAAWMLTGYLLLTLLVLFL